MLQEQSFVGESRIAKKILDEVHQLQGISRINVIIIGESGTGKEVIARAIHAGSDRAEGPFIPVNCTAIPHELAESTFFGHVRGAFSGASENHRGYFELAHDGTLFLDEIGDMPLDLQPKLLRAIEDGSVLPVGGTVPKQVDVRIIAATNQDLLKRITEGAFRKELYFRLGQFTIEVPPLRERKEDIPLLVEHFLELSSAEMGIPQPMLSPEALSMLKTYYFPGNVRELRNIVESALLRSRGERVIGREHLDLIDSSVLRTLQPDLEAAPQVEQKVVEQSSPAPEDMERMVIQRAQKSADLEAEEKKILSHVREHGSINNAECRELLSVDRRRATYLLRKLCRYGLLKAEGELRWARYVLVHDTVTETAPVLRALCTVDAGMDQTVHEGDTVSFSGSFSDPVSSYAHTASIDWGDGSPSEDAVVTEANGSGTVTSTHVYTTAGRHTVTLTVTDEAGDAGTDTAIVDVIGTAYVDFYHPDSDDSPGHGSADKPYKTIQYGIDMVLSGSTVVVVGGTPESPYIYTGPGNVNLDMGGKAITVRSSSGFAGCIIDCQNSGRGFIFHNGEGPDSILNGFTIENGNAPSSDEIDSDRGGGIYCLDSSPVITKTIIMNGRASIGGGGIYCGNSCATITNTLIKGNYTKHGGGLCCIYSSPTIINTTIVDNKATLFGGGIYCNTSSAIVTNTILWGNSSNEIHIIWDDFPNEIYGDGLTISYSDIQGGFAGVGNIDMDPLFLHADNDDHRLRDDSPCIGAGTMIPDVPDDWPDKDRIHVPVEDIEGHPRPGFPNSNPNIGAYEGIREPSGDSTDAEPRPVQQKIIHVSTTGDDINGDGIVTPYRTIQKGIDNAVDGDIVLVADGVYTGSGNVNLDFKGRAITVGSSSGPAGCIIDCENVPETHGFYFRRGEGPDSILDGFTIRNGHASYGGGILCRDSSPKIDNITVTGSTADNDGGGIQCFRCSPAITNATIMGNTAKANGGGIECHQSSATIINTIITRNMVVGPYGGGGIQCRDSSPTIVNTIITGNAANSGAGIFCFQGSSPAIVNSTIAGNQCYTNGDGNGVACQQNSSAILKNTILWDDDPIRMFDDEGYVEATYCDVPGGWSGTGNIDLPPQFVDADNGDYHLSDTSPCIGAGTSDGAPAEDIEGNPRRTPPNIGAYE